MSDEFPIINDISFTSQQLQQFSEDVGSLCVPSHIPILDNPPDRFTFLRDYVWPSRPCIIRNAIVTHSLTQHTPLLLTLDDLIHHVGPDMIITVNVTPDGRGDCIRSVITQQDGSSMKKKMFVKPQQIEMTLTSFRDQLRKKERSHHGNATANSFNRNNHTNSRNAIPSWTRLENEEDEKEEEQASQPIMEEPRTDEQGLAIFSASTSTSTCTKTEIVPSHGVYYYSLQNNCLLTEFASLWNLNLFPSTFPFAQDAFHTGPPQAINLWIGNEQAVSSMHKDPFENLFYVLSGEKVFTLCPPTDALFLQEEEFTSASFVWDDLDKKWKVQVDNDDGGNKVRWLEPDVSCLVDDTVKEGEDESTISRNRLMTTRPYLAYTHPIHVHVQEGELLYLPALWYHRVTQSCETIGLNYWYDMRFDTPLWPLFNLHQHVR